MTDYLTQLEIKTSAALAMAEELKDGMIDINRELDKLLKQLEQS